MRPSLGRELWSLGPAAAPVKPNLHFESARYCHSRMSHWVVVIVCHLWEMEGTIGNVLIWAQYWVRPKRFVSVCK